MATAHSGPGDSVGVEASRDGSHPTENVPFVGYGHLIGLLWLYPEITSLTKGLLESLQKSWHSDSAFLLEMILELQVVYRDCQSNDHTGSPLVPEGALLESEDVLSIARTLSLNVTAYCPESYEDVINREMRFKVVLLSPRGPVM